MSDVINELNQLFSDPGESMDASPATEEPAVEASAEEYNLEPTTAPAAPNPIDSVRADFEKMQQQFNATAQQLYWQNQQLQSELAEQRKAREAAAQPPMSDLDKLMMERMQPHLAPLQQRLEAYEAKERAREERAQRDQATKAAVYEAATAADNILFDGFSAEKKQALRQVGINLGMTAAAASNKAPTHALAELKTYFEAYADARDEARRAKAGAAVAASKAAAPAVSAPNSVNAQPTSARALTDEQRAQVRTLYGQGHDGIMKAWADGFSRLKR